MINRCLAFLFGWVLLCSVVLSSACFAAATDSNPLRPPDTSSPRESLRNFITMIDSAYIQWADVIRSYILGERLYLTADERRKQAAIIPSVKDAVESFDVSGVPP